MPLIFYKPATEGSFDPWMNGNTFFSFFVFSHRSFGASRWSPFLLPIRNAVLPLYGIMTPKNMAAAFKTGLPCKILAELCTLVITVACSNTMAPIGHPFRFPPFRGLSPSMPTEECMSAPKEILDFWSRTP